MNSRFSARVFASALTFSLLLGSAALQSSSVVVERGPHHRVVGDLETGAEWTELADGMHRWADQEWVDAEEVIEVTPGGAAATGLAYQVSFAANLNMAGSIHLVAPDGQPFRSHVLCICITDYLAGRSLLVGRLRDSVGEVVPPNQVIYRDAFEGISADYLCTARKGAFEADVVLREKVALPAGFDPATTAIEVLTEFIEAPEPKTDAAAVDAALGLVDERLDFGAMQMVQGRAFRTDFEVAPLAASESPAVTKRWTTIDGRRFLVESVPYEAAKELMAGLTEREISIECEDRNAPLLAAHVGQPPKREPDRPMTLAQTSPAERAGWVIDYQQVFSNPYWTFATGYTYLVNGSVTISTFTAIQTRTVIKFTDTACLTLSGTVTCPGATQERAVFTSKDDDTVGQVISGSTGNPSMRSFLAVNPYYVASSTTFRRLEVRYAGVGLKDYSPTSHSHSVLDCRFEECNVGVGAYYTTLWCDDLVMCSVFEHFKDYGGATIYIGDLITDCEGIGPPVIVTQPANRTVVCSGTAVFSVVALGERLRYQWFQNDAAIAGATNSSLTLINPPVSAAGTYYVVVANAHGPVTSSRVQLTVITVPQIVTQPRSQKIRQGGSVSFSVAALGWSPSYPLTYQWRKNGTVISGATAWEYTIPNVQSTHAGTYSVDVSNVCGLTTSAGAVLTVVLNAYPIVYTVAADFDKGYLLNVNHTEMQDTLRINAVPTPVPCVNMACSTRGTMARIDVNSGQVVGEYATAPVIPDIRPDPSRTTVDRFGNVWLANRQDELYDSSSQRWRGSVCKIGLAIGGTRGDLIGGSFSPNPSGQYLKPPFIYNTCRDRNQDGLIRTSRGLVNVLAWSNPGGVDSQGGVNSAEDEAILLYTRVNACGVRTLAVDADNNLWVGGFGSDNDGWQNWHEKRNGNTGAVMVSRFDHDAGGYGGLIDGYGVLWSANKNVGLLRYNTLNASWSNLGFNHGSYGLGIDPQTQHVWHTECGHHLPGGVYEYLPGGSVVNPNDPYATMDYQPEEGAKGVVVDNSGNVWVAHATVPDTIPGYHWNTVGHMRTDGMLVGVVDVGGSPAPAPGEGAAPTGAAVDSNGKIWVSALRQNAAVRINPNAGPTGAGGYPIGEVDLRVNLGDQTLHPPPYNKKAEPYNYSDMTGFVTLGSTFPSGSWIVVHDEGMTRTWSQLYWAPTSQPVNTGLIIEVRAASTVMGLPDQPFIPVNANGTFTPQSGRYLEIRVTLWRKPLVNERPRLDSLTVPVP